MKCLCDAEAAQDLCDNHSTGSQHAIATSKYIQNLIHECSGISSAAHYEDFTVAQVSDVYLCCIQDSELGQEASAYIQQHPLSEQEPHMVSWNGGIGKRQFAWLADQLQQASTDNQRVIIACHHQLGLGELDKLLERAIVLIIEAQCHTTVGC